MTTSLETSSVKEKIYDYIDVIKTWQSSTGERISFKCEFDTSFRQLLQSHNPNLDKESISDNLRYSDKDLQCFVNSANTKHAINCKEHYSAISAYSLGFGFVIGSLIAVKSFEEWLGLVDIYCNVNKGNLGYITIGGAIVGGISGAYLAIQVVHSSMEQDEFWSEVLQCSDSISLVELPVVLTDV